MGRATIGASPATFLSNPTLFAQMISKYKACVTTGPNFGYELCAKKTSQEVADTLDLSSMRCALNGSEPVRLDTLCSWNERFSSFRPIAHCPVYGMAESTLIITTHLPDEVVNELKIDERAYRQNRVKVLVKEQLEHDGVKIVEKNSSKEEEDEPGSGQMMIVSEKSEGKEEEEDGEEGETTLSVVGCGWPVDCEVAIVDKETCELQNMYSSGEIWVRGRRVAHGYYGRPDLTEETFHGVIKEDGLHHGSDLGGGWLRTGDIGFLYEGQVYLCGRKKDILIIGGKNFYPNDLEATVDQSNSAIRPGCCAVFAMVDEEDKELICCVIEVRSHQIKNMDYEAICDDIANAVRRGHEIKCSIVVLLPARTILKTTSGKIRRKQTKENYLNGLFQVLHEKHYRNDRMNPILSDPAILVPILHCCGGVSLGDDKMGLECCQNVMNVFLRLMTAQIICSDATHTVQSESSFLELGLTSIEQVELRHFLSQAFPSLTIDPMMLYDYGPINLLTFHLLEQYFDQQGGGKKNYFAPNTVFGPNGKLSVEQKRKVLHFVFLYHLTMRNELPISTLLEEEDTQIRDLPHFLDFSPDKIREILTATKLTKKDFLSETSDSVRPNWTIGNAVDVLFDEVSNGKTDTEIVIEFGAPQVFLFFFFFLTKKLSGRLLWIKPSFFFKENSQDCCCM